MNLIEKYRDVVEEIILYSRLCYSRNLVGAAGGNLSARLSDDLYLVTGSGVALRDVASDNLLIVNRQQKVIEGPSSLRPSKETGFHFSIYDYRPEVKAVVHVHPMYSTIFSGLGMHIPLSTVSAELKLRQGPVVEKAHPGSQDLSDMITEALKVIDDATTVLVLKQHGIVTFGKIFCDAFNDAELCEDTAKIAYGRMIMEKLVGMGE